MNSSSGALCTVRNAAAHNNISPRSECIVTIFFFTVFFDTVQVTVAFYNADFNGVLYADFDDGVL